MSVVTLSVLSSFRTSQIYKKKFSNEFVWCVSHFNLTNSMRSTRSIICWCLMSRALLVSKSNQVNHLLGTFTGFFLKALHLNFALCVLHYSKFFLIVKEITDLSTINFEETDSKVGTTWSYLEKFSARFLVNTVNGEGFSRTCLTIGKTRNDPFFEKCR